MKTLRLAAVCLAVAALGLAQEFRATINGRVIDPSGSAVPNATIEVRNTGTNEAASAKSDSQGNYVVPFLRPGDYKITVTATGFKRIRARA